VCPHRTTRLPLDGFSCASNFMFRIFTKFVGTSRFWLKSDNCDILLEDERTFLSRRWSFWTIVVCEVRVGQKKSWPKHSSRAWSISRRFLRIYYNRLYCVAEMRKGLSSVVENMEINILDDPSSPFFFLLCHLTYTDNNRANAPKTLRYEEISKLFNENSLFSSQIFGCMLVLLRKG